MSDEEKKEETTIAPQPDAENKNLIKNEVPDKDEVPDAELEKAGGGVPGTGLPQTFGCHPTASVMC